MAAKHKGKIDYAQRMRAIRPFVTFNYDLRHALSSAAKARITRYYEAVQKLTVRPHQVYRARDEKRLRAVQEFSQHDKRLTALRVAFVPAPAGEKVDVRISKSGEVHTVSRHVSVYAIPLDPERVATEGVDYVEAEIAARPRRKRYSVQAGEFEIPGAYPRDQIAEKVADLATRYGADKYDPDDKNSHYFGNWLGSVRGYDFHNQADLSEYREERRKASKEKAREYVRQGRRESRDGAKAADFWLNDETREAKRGRGVPTPPWRKTTVREYFIRIGQGYKEVRSRT